MANTAFLFFSIDTLNLVFLPKFMHVGRTRDVLSPSDLEGVEPSTPHEVQINIERKTEDKKYVMHTSQYLFFSFWEK